MVGTQYNGSLSDTNGSVPEVSTATISKVGILSDVPEVPMVVFNVDSLLVLMMSRLGQTARSVALALAAVGSHPDGPVEQIPGVFMHTVVGDSPISAPSTREECRGWLIGAGLRDGTDGLGILCEDAWRVCCLAERMRQGPIPIQQAVAANLRSVADMVLGKEAVKIDGPGLSGKLTELLARFGIDVSWRSEIDSVVLARNCLTHRLGVVAERDLNDATSRVLRLKFRHHTLHAGMEGTPHLAITQSGQTVEGGMSLFIRIGDTYERSFGLGDRLSLTSQEFMHLLTTLNQAGVEIAHGAAVFVNRCLPKAPPSQPQPPS